MSLVLFFLPGLVTKNQTAFEFLGDEMEKLLVLQGAAREPVNLPNAYEYFPYCENGEIH